MNHRQKLADQYEDALFALLMDEVAEAEGIRLQELNERLKKDPEMAVPDELEKKCLKTIDKEFRRRHFKGVKRSSAHVLKFVAAFVLVVALLFTTAFAVSTSFRTKVLNTIIEIFDDHGEINFEPTVEYKGLTPEFGRIDLSGISDQYSIETAEVSEYCTYIELQRNDGEVFYILVDTITESVGYNFDTEDSIAEKVAIHGEDATLYRKTAEGIEKTTLVWVNLGQGCIVNIWGFSVSADHIINIAENLKLR